MEITIPVKSAKEAVTGLTKVVGQHFPNILIQPQERGIRLMGTNADEWAAYTCPEAVSDLTEPFVMALSDLRAMLRTIRGESITIRPKFDSTTVEARYQEDLWQATVEFERVIYDKEGWLTTLFDGWDLKAASDFRDVLMFAWPFSSKDDTRWVLNGVYFSEDGAIVATDGRRLVCKSGAISPFGQNTIVRETQWLKWKQAGPIQGVGRRDNNIFVKTPNWQYTVRNVEGTYPNYQQVIPSRTPETYFELSDDAIPALRLIQSLLSGGNDNCIRLEALKTKTKLILNARNHKQNRRVQIDMEGHGTMNVVTGMNSEFMLEALQAGFRKFHQDDNLSPSVSYHDGWTHVLMPMRVD